MPSDEAIETPAAPRPAARRKAPRRKKRWQAYIEAPLGFRNHWYAAFFSHELPESGISQGLGEGAVNVRTETILGEKILFRRSEGRLYAVQDWCPHKGVPFSAKAECYTRDTITCWYHGFTFDLASGTLTTIVSDPASPLIGKIALRTYPVAERKGMVFVFIGDQSPPPPLEDDLQPGFLDPGFAVYPEGWAKTVKCNWRLGAENGFDPAHAYLHRNSPVVRAYRMPTVLGDTGLSENHGMEIVAGPGPRGIKLIRGAGVPVWDAQIGPERTLSARFKPGDEGVTDEMVPEVSIWLPGGLKVDPFPAPGIVHFEWYVPIDEHTHKYIITWGRYVDTPQQEARFIEEVGTLWRDFVPAKFNNEDVMAREAMHDFYHAGDGWYREHLFGPDIVITRWRELASMHNRGLQRRGVA